MMLKFKVLIGSQVRAFQTRLPNVEWEHLPF